MNQYLCPKGHITERKDKPRYVRCRFHFGNAGSTHSPNCRLWHECGMRAALLVGLPTQ
jgi:hypothetical protein